MSSFSTSKMSKTYSTSFGLYKYLLKKYSIKFNKKGYFLALDDGIIQQLEWEKTRIEELDIRATELSTETHFSVNKTASFALLVCN